MEDIQTDKEALVFDLRIYLNDYDSFNVKSPAGFLIYDDPSNNKNDITLTVTVPYNSTGLDRYDTIIIDYRIDGVTSKLESIIVTQTGI
jgi:cellulase/cellobiase CelA1